MKKTFVALAASAILATGCSVLSQPATPTETLVVQYVTLKVVDGDPATAAKVIDIAKEARSYFDNELVSVAIVREAVLKRVSKLDLDAADTLLATALVDAVASELQARVGEGLIAPDAKVRVNQVLDAVVQAASLAQ